MSFFESISEAVEATISGEAIDREHTLCYRCLITHHTKPTSSTLAVITSVIHIRAIIVIISSLIIESGVYQRMIAVM